MFRHYAELLNVHLLWDAWETGTGRLAAFFALLASLGVGVVPSWAEGSRWVAFAAAAAVLVTTMMKAEFLRFSALEAEATSLRPRHSLEEVQRLANELSILGSSLKHGERQPGKCHPAEYWIGQAERFVVHALPRFAVEFRAERDASREEWGDPGVKPGVMPRIYGDCHEAFGKLVARAGPEDVSPTFHASQLHFRTHGYGSRPSGSTPQTPSAE